MDALQCSTARLCTGNNYYQEFIIIYLVARVHNRRESILTTAIYCIKNEPASREAIHLKCTENNYLPYYHSYCEECWSGEDAQ